MARCDDVECNSATLSSVGTEPTYNGGAIALRADNRPVLIENTFSGARNLITCGDASCATASRAVLPNPFDVADQLRLRPGEIPAYVSGTIGSGGWWQCSDANCSNSSRHVLISDTETNQRGHGGRIVFGTDPRPFGIFFEQQLRDIWLVLPMPVAIFADGFEP